MYKNSMVKIRYKWLVKDSSQRTFQATLKMMLFHKEANEVV